MGLAKGPQGESNCDLDDIIVMPENAEHMWESTCLSRIHAPERSFRLPLDLQPERQNALGVLDNLISSKLRPKRLVSLLCMRIWSLRGHLLAVHTVHEADGHLRDSAPHRLCPHHHLHLESISLALRARDDLLQHTLLIQPKAARQITDTRSQHHIRKQVGSTRDKLALQIPPEHTTITGVPRPRDDIVVGRLLQSDHLGDEFRVVAEIGVHDDDKVARTEVEAVDVSGAETELASARLEEDVGGVGFDKLVGDFLGAIGATVVDNDELPIKLAAGTISECDSRESSEIRELASL